MPRAAYGLLLLALWVAWALYWFISAFGNKPVQKREGILSRVSYSVPLFISAFLLANVHLRGWLGERFIEGPARGIAYWLGVILLIAGLGYTVWARRTLGGNWSGSVTLKESHELVRAGPYAVTRHPIYTGILLAVLGSAVAIHQWRGIVALALTFVGLLYKSRIEERFMTGQFPDAYPTYRAEVRALIPGIY